MIGTSAQYRAIHGTALRTLLRAVPTLLLAMAATAALPESAVAENKRVGNSYEFEMEGNPSTGYKWKLNAQASTGLDVVKVEALGYGKAKSRKVGAPAVFIFRITCIGSGFARLQFDYVSPGSNRKVARSHTHDLRCE